MTLPVVFANLASGNQNLALIDNQFAAFANVVTIPCTASGTNAITLTPIGTGPVLPSYVELISYVFKAAGSSTGLVTLGQTGLALLPAYRADGVTQITLGDIVTGHLYAAYFDAALNSGNGGFFLCQATVPASAATAGGSFYDLTVKSDATFPDTEIDVTASEIIMENPATGALLNSQAPAFTINTANVGVVNGLDTGSLVPSTWYYVFAISNGTIVGGLLSLSQGNPTMPTGYSFRKRLGARFTDPNNGLVSAVTITIASPAVVNRGNHGLTAGAQLVFSTTGALPTGITAGQTYYVINPGLTANQFEFSTSPNGVAVTTTGTQSGTQTITVPNTRLKRITQLGRTAQYLPAGIGTSTPFLPIVFNGIGGTYSATNPILGQVGIGSIVPPTATDIRLAAYGSWQAATASNFLVAPNQNYGGTSQGPQGVNGNTWPIVGAAAALNTVYGELVLESGNIWLAADQAGFVLACVGWRDNV